MLSAPKVAEEKRNRRRARAPGGKAGRALRIAANADAHIKSMATMASPSRPSG